jgi:putative tricarboxylic transport membrane protein
MRTNDAISGAILIALAVVMIALTATFPPFAGQKYGPSLFPRLLGAGLILCGVLLILRGLKGRRQGDALVSAPAWLAEPWRLVSFLLVPGVTLLSILAWDKVGFVPITVLSLLAMFLWFRVRPATAVFSAIVATVLLQLFFGKVMRVPLPLGWLLNLPPGWLKFIT